MAGWILLGTLALAFLGIIWRGYVLSVVWAWFIADRFGLPVLTVAQALGVALVSATLAHRYRPAQDSKTIELVADMAFTPLLILAIGWIVRSFI